MEMITTRRKKVDTTTDPIDIKRIMQEYYIHLNAKKFDNFDKIDKLLERHKLSKATQVEIDNPNGPIVLT